MAKPIKESDDLYLKVSKVLHESRKGIVRAVNQTMVHAYFRIGEMIFLNVQDGQLRSQYGKNVLSQLSDRLTKEFGKGFSVTNIKQMRSFYIKYSIRQTLSDEFKLSWSHYVMPIIYAPRN